MDIKEISAELMAILKDNVVAGVEYAKQQFPDLCQQIIRWGIMQKVGSSIISILVITISTFFLVRAFKIRYKQDFRWTENEAIDASLVISWIVGGIAGLISLIFMINNIFILLQIYYAPKLYLIDAFKELIR